MGAARNNPAARGNIAAHLATQIPSWKRNGFLRRDPLCLAAAFALLR